MSVESSFVSQDQTLACSLTYHPLDVAKVTDWVGADEAGAVALFVGTTRNSFQGKRVKRLEYEAYSRLAMRTMVDILLEARRMIKNLSERDKTPSHAPSPSPSPYAYNSTPIRQPYQPFQPSYQAPPPPPPPPPAPPTPPIPAPSPSPSSLLKLAIHHRLGPVPVRSPSIIIAVSSPHRKEAFVACEWILEEVKKRVQVWKKEVYDTDSGLGDRKTEVPVVVDERGRKWGVESGVEGGVEGVDWEWKANAVYPRTDGQVRR